MAQFPALSPVAFVWAFWGHPGSDLPFCLGLSVDPIKSIWLCLLHSTDPLLQCLFFDSIFFSDNFLKSILFSSCICSVILANK